MKVVINKGSAFQVSDEQGNIPPGKEYGLYYQDTRFLSYLALDVNEMDLLLLNSSTVDYYSAVYYLTNPYFEGVKANTLSFIRKKFVGEGMHEDLDIINHANHPVVLRVRFNMAVDFADIFEIKKTHIQKEGKIEITQEETGIIFRYKHGDYIRKTSALFKSKEKPEIKGHSVVFHLNIPPRQMWHTCIDFSVGVENKVSNVQYTCDSFGLATLPFKKDRERWFSNSPVLISDHDALTHSYRQALTDLIALRIREKEISPDLFVPAAGIPWFATLFGRDSLITSYQTLLVNPEIAKGTLKSLARFQGKKVNKYKAEEPGKILHEIRFGELAYLGRIPHTPYYGTIDATILFLVLVGEYYWFTHERNFIEELMPNIQSALDWIELYGDKDKDGYIEYQKNTDQGLDNQGWKDTGDSINFRSGQLAPPPIALSEVQGYVYQAKRGISRIFRQLGKTEAAEKLLREASELKERFNGDFWLPREKHFALALDGSKNKVDSMTSNNGHLLWSGIVDEEKAGSVVEKLMNDDMFSGWGVRTLSMASAAFNPLSYHNGSVWPFDNSLIAAGLRRYGFDEEAKRIIQAMVEASSYFPKNRLPELFCGYPRASENLPVEFPNSCSPQAWSTGAIIMFLRTLLGMRIDEEEAKTISLNPLLLDSMNSLSLRNICLNSAKVDLDIVKVEDKIKTQYKVTEGDLNIKILTNS